MPRALSSRGVKGEIGDWMREGATQNGLVAVAPGVQDLQRDLAALGVHRVGDDLVAPRRAAGAERAAEGLEPAFDVGREAAGHHQPHAAARTLGEEGGHGREVLAPVFEAGVHAAHQHAVLEGGEAEVERREQVGVGVHARDGRPGVPSARQGSAP